MLQVQRMQASAPLAVFSCHREAKALILHVQAPVFRELYSEKKVVAEERRSRIDNSPMGRFQETFLSSAISNNYRRPIIGYEQDVAALGRREVEAFFRERYGPKNLVITIAGDTTPEKVHVQVVVLSLCKLLLPAVS